MLILELHQDKTLALEVHVLQFLLNNWHVLHRAATVFGITWGLSKIDIITYAPMLEQVIRGD